DAIPASEYLAAPNGGGSKADMGYRELLAVPATLLLGKEGNSCGLGSAGIDSVEFGLVYVTDASQGVDETTPSSWTSATLSTRGQAGSYWTGPITPDQGDGLYRLYSRPTDAVGNVSISSDWYRSAFIADGTVPQVRLVSPSGSTDTSAPAIMLSMEVSDWTPTGSIGETMYNVGNTYFVVDGEPISATRSITIASQDGWQRYEGYVALENGYHSINAVAEDQAGNKGQSAPYLVSVGTTQNEAALTTPSPGSAVNSSNVTLEGFVHFQDTSGDGQVEILVDDVSQGMAALADTSAQATSWSKSVALAGDGSHAITLRASRTAGSTSSADATATLVLDRQAPSISFVAPTGVLTGSVTLSGMVSDTTSGVASVSVSVDGGYSYELAELDSSGNWSYVWKPSSYDYASIPLRVKAVDSGGNAMVQSGTLLVDNESPSRIELTSLSPQAGSYITAPSTIELSWLQPYDGSGEVSVLIAVDQMTDTLPSSSQAVEGTSYSAQISGAGSWYIHVATIDGSGNKYSDHFGPWFAGTDGTLLQASTAQLTSESWRSSVLVDGFIDIANGEWNPETELLGTDPRPRRAYSLFSTWDADYLYIGWRGPMWGPMGTGRIHLDTIPGGTNMDFRIGTTLPFEADYILIPGFEEHTLLRYVNGTWEAVENVDRLDAHGANGDTEIRVSRSVIEADGSVQILATVVSEGGRVDSVLPAAQNPTSGPWQSAYSWTSLGLDVVPNADQPEAHHARVRISSPDINGRPPGPNSDVRYVFRVSNDGKEPLEQLVLIVSGSEGLAFESLSGWPAAQVQAQGDRWFIDLGELQVGARRPLTISARVLQGLSETGKVTVTAELGTEAAASEPDLSYQTLSHVVDSEPPSVNIDLPGRGATLRTGQQKVTGSAYDQGGAGIARVEVRVNDGVWTEAQGTKGWSAMIDVPAEGEFMVSARAIDVYGYVSEEDSAQVMVDNEGPQAMIDMADSVLGGSLARVSGTAVDPFLAGGGIQRVEMQVDEDAWTAATRISTPGTDGTVSWYRTWRLPEEEGVQHSLRVRAVDVAGNVGPASESTLVTVDSIAPVSTILSPETGDTVTGQQQLVWGLAQDGWGLASVDVSLDGGANWQTALLGDEARSLLQSLDVPDVPEQDQLPEGAEVWGWAVQLPGRSPNLAIRSRATDLSGNVEGLRTPVRVTQAPLRILLPLILQ
ncbi:MAG: hypothetical protein GY753_15255, partial [Gammaproteobacteria bacterium]|nr:hypothetical protein [Gammaproteobacteria bacterium]